jgi:ribosome-binding protein aMBF1 (putative translation factor)
MAECFRCGTTGDKVRLFDAISEEGIVKVCEKCALDENLPIIKRPFDSLSKSPQLRIQEIKLREIIDKKSNHNKREKDFPDLIDNFHWIIMRARRMKHMTQEQLGREVGESESTIKLAEKGILSSNYLEFINRIENVLNIRIFNDEIRERIENQEKKLGFDPFNTKRLTISDLQDMKNQKKNENGSSYTNSNKNIGNKFSFGKKAGKKENRTEFIEKDEEDLSQEDMDRIIFGK